MRFTRSKPGNAYLHRVSQWRKSASFGRRERFDSIGPSKRPSTVEVKAEERAREKLLEMSRGQNSDA